MVLNLSPIPSFNSCRTVKFAKNHQYITRTYYQISVLLFVLDGELRFKEDGKEIVLSKGEYYIQRDGLFQEGVPIYDPPTFFYIEFMGTYSEVTFGLPIKGTFNAQTVMPLANRLEELFKQNSRDRLHVRSNANLFILNAYMNHILSDLLSRSNALEKKSILPYLIHSYIQSNYFNKITLTDLAKRFSYDKDYLSEIFKEQYGCTPLQYQTNLRMEQAAWLFETTKLSAEQIAFNVGYADFSTFYRNFKKYSGVSPSSYRASLSEKQESIPKNANKRKT